jgi:cytochrome c oxidase subunit III
MVTALSPTEYDTEVRPSNGSIGRGGDFDEGREGGRDPWDGQGPREPGSSSRIYRLGMWLCLSSITMLFAGLSSAYVFRLGASGGWVAVPLPRVLIWNTGMLLMSSLALEISRRARRTRQTAAYRHWLTLTALLGGGFLGLQLRAWRQLASQGIFLNTSPHSSFFYLITGTHGVHLFGGMVALLYVLYGAWKYGVALGPRESTLDVIAMYWHFMAGLWIYLFMLLFMWRY